MEKLTLEQFAQKVQADEALQKELAADFQAGKKAKDFIEKYSLDATEEELNKVYEMMQNPDAVRELSEEELEKVSGGTVSVLITAGIIGVGGFAGTMAYMATTNR